MNSSEMVREYVKCMHAANAVFGGESAYHLQRLAAHSEALLTRFAPIKVGQKAVIAEQPNCNDGWSGSTKTLEVGRTGRITEVDYTGNGFQFTWSPDREWYRNHDGEWVETETTHTYYLPARCLGPVGVREMEPVS